jgi:hypothetical protein
MASGTFAYRSMLRFLQRELAVTIAAELVKRRFGSLGQI